jgi:hypothetical protein
LSNQKKTVAHGRIYNEKRNIAIIANCAIFAGGGGATSFSFSPGGSHRSEQPVFFLQYGAGAFLTNSAIINTAGRLVTVIKPTLHLTIVIIQRAITCGEYVGGTIIVNHTAIIAFPADDGIVDAAMQMLTTMESILPKGRIY